MTNDQFLIVSYFAVAVLAIALGAGAWLCLRQPFGGVTEAVSKKELSLVLKRLFPAGLVLPAFLGFVSVSYEGCNLNYELVVRTRWYLVRKSQEQISSILLWTVAAVLVWDLILLLLLVLKLARTSVPASGESSPPHTRLP